MKTTREETCLWNRRHISTAVIYFSSLRKSDTSHKCSNLQKLKKTTSFAATVRKTVPRQVTTMGTWCLGVQLGHPAPRVI